MGARVVLCGLLAAGGWSGATGWLLRASEGRSGGRAGQLVGQARPNAGVAGEPPTGGSGGDQR
jgi:hypothetical protein